MISQPSAVDGVNVEPFTTVDPFNQDDAGDARASNDDSDIAKARKVQGPSNPDSMQDDRAKAVPGGESGIDEENRHPFAEKITAAANDVAPVVMDKVRTAAHRFHLDSMKATGISKAFNPTSVRMHVRIRDDSDESDGRRHEAAVSSSERTGDAGKELAVLWRARDNRKGRNSIAVPLHTAQANQSSRINYSGLRSSIREVSRNVLRMFTTFPYWDMAFWSGWSYTVGSALFVLDGCFAFTPIAFPWTEWAGESTYAVPLLFFFGALFYQVGAVAAYLEAVNDGSFHGSAMRRLLEGHQEDERAMLDEKLHAFFGHLVPHPGRQHDEEKAEQDAYDVDPEIGWKTKDRRERPGSIYPPTKAPAPRRGGVDLGGTEEGEASEYMTWRWWPSWHVLRTHHVYEIGYLACTIQLFGVTLYGITGIVVLPGILSSLNQWQENAAYWIPQMVAAACFLIASIMFTFETQEKWWKPELKVLGWWIGLWSTVGSVGFELCAAFGPSSGSHSWAEYQSELSSTWGSAAYLFGSFLQWYEAVNKHPFAEALNEPGDMKSWQIHPL